MKRKILSIVCIVAAMLSVGCSNKNNEPVTVTLWHVYGAQTESPMNKMIDVFNNTVGKDKNIKVKVTSVSNNNTIHENVLASAFKDPGAPELPDMFVSYPKTILAMPDSDILVDYNDYFSEKEFDEYVPEFLEDGKIDNKQLIMPVAKSTEVLFLNKTAFDRFAEAVGADESDLHTWEGLFALAEKYYNWTDDKTPDIEDDGKAFFAHDFHFNYFQVGVESLGKSFFENNNISYNEELYNIWKPYARAALNGAVWLENGYATDPFQTGDAIVCAASSASILYFSDMVTYSDNTSEELRITALPIPVFENGENLVIQRGAGICTVKSTPEKEKACAEFLKWITEESNNVEFVVNTGYMPVKTKAFEKKLPEAIKEIEEEGYISLYEAYTKTEKEFEFYTPPVFEKYLEIESEFEEQIRLCLMTQKAVLDKNEDISEEQIKKAFNAFKIIMEK